MLDTRTIKAITLDLDDTLWPVAPVILRAEAAMSDWLRERAPKTAALFTQPAQRLALRQRVQAARPDLGHDLATLRQEVIRLGLQEQGEDTRWVGQAYQVFITARMQVDLYADSLEALDFLSQRYPLVALSNGNADVHQVGIGQYFKAGLSAQHFGSGKPEAAIFVAAAQAAGVQPHEVLHVGDDAALDVLGALNAGMQTAWVNRHAQDWAHPQLPHISVRDLAELCAALAAGEGVGGA